MEPTFENVIYTVMKYTYCDDVKNTFFMSKETHDNTKDVRLNMRKNIVKYWPNGNLKLKCSLDHKLRLTGQYLLYNQYDGGLKRRSNYAFGKRHGLHEEWDSGWVDYRKCSYKYGKLHGTDYHTSGGEEVTSNYKNGKLHGPYIDKPEVYADVTGMYKNGKKHGVWSYSGFISEDNRRIQPCRIRYKNDVKTDL